MAVGMRMEITQTRLHLSYLKYNSAVMLILLDCTTHNSSYPVRKLDSQKGSLWTAGPSLRRGIKEE
jgi:hypothetical protein